MCIYACACTPVRDYVMCACAFFNGKAQPPLCFISTGFSVSHSTHTLLFTPHSYKSRNATHLTTQQISLATCRTHSPPLLPLPIPLHVNVHTDHPTDHWALRQGQRRASHMPCVPPVVPARAVLNAGPEDAAPSPRTRPFCAQRRRRTRVPERYHSHARYSLC